MEEYLSNLASDSSLPVLTAFALGLLTAISPCPLATNITAIGFLSKDVERQRTVFVNGVVYTLGRALSYTALAFIIYLGADQFRLSGAFQQYGERFIGPVLVLIGIVMLGIIPLKFPALNGLTRRFEQKESRKGYWDVLLLGVVFALAFCPYSGVLYFGMLIPLTISQASGLYLPVVFAIATGIPVILFAWLLAYAVSGVGSWYNRMKAFEFWFRKVIAVVFIGVGVYYIAVIYF